MKFDVCFYEAHYLAAPKRGVPRWVPGWRPVARSLTWTKLVEALTTPRVYAADHDRDRLPSWAPHTLTTPRRAADNVASVSCLVLDYDDGTAIDTARKTWSGWCYLLHTSRSHALAAPRFRVVLPLEAPVPAALWPRAWRWAADLAGRAVDEACKDAARLYFLPARLGAAPYEAHVHDDGPLLDLRPFDRLPDRDAEARARRADQARDRWQDRPVRVDDRRRAVAAILREHPDARLRAAEMLGAQIVDLPGGRLARGIRCPRCGQPDVWFPIDAQRMRGAACNHRNTCGWHGPLIDLVDPLQAEAAA